MTDAVPFTADVNGWVRECVPLDIPSSTGNDWFEWTIQKTARVFKVRAVPVHHREEGARLADLASIDQTQLLGLWLNRHPISFRTTTKDGKHTTAVSWKNGTLLMPRDVVLIHVRSPVGCYLVGELELAWLAN